MPHIIVDYSANLDAKADVGKLCEALHAAALTTPYFELGAIRVRALRCGHYAVADQLPENAYAHIMVRIGEGRSDDAKKEMGEVLWSAATAFFGPLFATPHFALTLEIVEIDGRLSWKKNAIHPRIRGTDKK